MKSPTGWRLSPKPRKGSLCPRLSLPHRPLSACCLSPGQSGPVRQPSPDLGSGEATPSSGGHPPSARSEMPTLLRVLADPDSLAGPLGGQARPQSGRNHHGDHRALRAPPSCCPRSQAGSNHPGPVWSVWSPGQSGRGPRKQQPPSPRRFSGAGELWPLARFMLRALGVGFGAQSGSGELILFL